MKKEHNMVSMLNNEALLEAYAGAIMAICDGSLDDFIDIDVMLSDVKDLQNEILNRMDKRKRKGVMNNDDPMV